MDTKEVREEVRKEFQVERVILFTDAVFAIVITLMAIEIRLPEDAGHLHGMGEIIRHLGPTIIAYMVSFFFIGSIWYQHLRTFSVLKDFDRGLIVRNMVLLFLVGLFPFTASLMTHTSHGPVGAAIVYMGVILSCIVAQFFLQYYILVQRPSLRQDVDISEQLVALKRRKVLILLFLVASVPATITYFLVDDPAWRPLSIWWVMLVPIGLRFFAPKKKATTEQS
jgi:uncharacterized membrane protein